MKLPTPVVASCLSALFLASACGGKAKGADTGADETADVPAGPLSPGAWQSMTAEQRGAFMGKTVMPVMSGLFVEFGTAAFANMDCQTCHGDGAEDGSFEMPNPGLPQLTAAMVMSPDPEHAAITEFMKNQVRPTMANLLGLPEWSPDQPDGFGCGGCHVMTR